MIKPVLRKFTLTCLGAEGYDTCNLLSVIQKITVYTQSHPDTSMHTQ